MITERIRPHFLTCEPYSSARDEFSGEAEIYLDANESADAPLGLLGSNRYPDPAHVNLRKLFAANNNLRSEQIFFGNGSDEAIDLLILLFCEPGVSTVLCCPPTYGMYAVSARLQNVACMEVPLDEKFMLREAEVISASKKSQLVFLCNPNNPTGTLYDEDVLLRIVRGADCPVVVDEAYIQFSGQKSLSRFVSNYSNLIVLQTFSKAWGIASLRVGVCIAGKELIQMLYRIKAPYNISGYSQQVAAQLLAQPDLLTKRVAEVNLLREELQRQLSKLSCVEKIFPSSTNFLLVRFSDATKAYRRLLVEKIVVRDRSSIPALKGCLRITVGTASENKQLVKVLSDL